MSENNTLCFADKHTSKIEIGEKQPKNADSLTILSCGHSQFGQIHLFSHLDSCLCPQKFSLMTINNVKNGRECFIKVSETQTFQTFSTLQSHWSNPLSH